MTEQQAGREVAVIPEQQPREITRLDTDSWVAVARPIFELANRVYDTDFVPRGLRGSEAATAAAMLYGREVGLPPMTALNVTHVIEGKPGLSAEAMRAMVFAAGHELEIVESSGALCTIRGRRRGQERWTPVTWTIDMARAAGLGGKNIWKSYPRTQLQARCTTELCRLIFPDVIHGFRSIEELEDMSSDDGQPAAAGEQPAGTTRVARKRAAAKKTAAAPPASDQGGNRAQPAVPPLPGEPGYDEAAPELVEGGEAGEANQSAEPAGEGADPPSTADVPGSDAADDAPEASSEGAGADPGAQTGEPGEATADVPEANDPGSPEDRDPAPRPLSRAQQRMIMSIFGQLGISGDQDREERLLITSSIVGREVTSTNELMSREAKTLIDTLSTVEGSREKLNVILDTIDEANAQRARAEAGDE